MIYNIHNIREATIFDNPLIYRRNDFSGKWDRYELMNEIRVSVRGQVFTIPAGFTWDHASVPQLLRGLIRHDVAALAWLGHDFFYKHQELHHFTRRQVDKIMLQWSLALYGTKRWSLRNIDLYTRYYAVRAFGGRVWNKKRDNG